MAVNLLSSETKKLVKKSGSTCVNTSETQYTWTIRNFSFCPSQVGDALISPTFSGGVQDDYNFRLILYPNGAENKNIGFLSLQLHFVPGKRSEVEAKCLLNILGNGKTEALETVYTELKKILKNETLYSHGRFISRSLVLNNTNGILPGDVLTIVCSIIIVEGITNTANENHSKGSRSTMYHQLHNDLSDLFESPKFCDVTLVACGQEIQAHKAMLAARSPVFAAMFTHEMKEQEENKVDIIDVDYDVLKEMLRYIYTGKITIPDNMADRLLIAADKYELEKLKDQCEIALCKNIAVDNAADLLLLGDLHSAGRLKNEALHFICTPSKDVMKSTSYQSLHHTHPHLIDEIVQALANKIIVSNVSKVTAGN